MQEERRTNRGGPLPLEARRLLWQRVWDRLLAPPINGQPSSADTVEQPSDETREGRRV